MTEVKKANLKEQIVKILSDEDTNNVDIFASYCQRILLEKDRDGKYKNPFMQTKTAEVLAQMFRRVKAEGLVFDGKHVTLQSTGISFDYVAYKNKMLIAYPETEMDLGTVKTGDTFTIENDNGKIKYKHTIANPFETADAKTINGAFCIIKNKRGEFSTLLSKEDIAKHQKAARTQMIWNVWFKEMVLKTVIKKACKYHFDDEFEGMNKIDNETIDLDRVLVTEEVGLDKVKPFIEKIQAITSLKELQAYYVKLRPEIARHTDVHEAYEYQKTVCKDTK